MRTIYEKEALFESLDAAVAELKEYIVGAVHRAELHQVEQQMFRQLQQVGRHGLETFVALSGTGYEAANPPLSEEGSPLEYKGTETKGSPYVSIFGGIQIYRAAYAHPVGGRVYPLDAQLNLPAHKYSYLLLKWLHASSADQDFRSAVDRFNEIFGFSFFPDLPLAAYVEPLRRGRGLGRCRAVFRAPDQCPAARSQLRRAHRRGSTSISATCSSGGAQGAISTRRSVWISCCW